MFRIIAILVLLLLLLGFLWPFIKSAGVKAKKARDKVVDAVKQDDEQ